MGPPPGRMRLPGYALALSAPVALAAVLLAAMQWITPAAGLTIWLAALAGTAAMLWRPLRDLRAVQQRLTQFADSEDIDFKRWPQLVDDDIDVALRNAARRFQGKSEGLMRAEARLRGLIDAMPDPLLTVDGRRKVTQANKAAAAMFGPSIAGRDIETVVRNPAVLEMLDGVLSGRAGARTEFSLPSPVERELVCHATPMQDPGDDPVVVLVFNDISDLRRTDRMRADFVANASHEIRTPLSTLAGCIETLSGPARDDPEAQTQFLEIMSQQAARMTRLVEDLLSLSRIEINEHTLPKGLVDLPVLLARVVDVISAGDPDVREKIHIQARDDLPQALGDDSELEQVFQNLIVNGLKYGGDSVEVEIDIANRRLPNAVSHGLALRVSVRDNGAGIPREHLPRLTERFYRVDTARSRQLGGTGLGLAIVKHIVNRHRGALSIESEVGEGSTFTVYLAAA